MSSPIATMSSPIPTIVDDEVVVAAPPVKKRKPRTIKAVVPPEPTPERVEADTIRNALADAEPVPMTAEQYNEENKKFAEELATERKVTPLTIIAPALREEEFVIVPPKKKSEGTAALLKKAKSVLAVSTIESLLADAEADDERHRDDEGEPDFVGDLTLALRQLLEFREAAELKRLKANEASKKSKSKVGETKRAVKAKLEDRVAKLEAVVHRDGSGNDDDE